MKQLPKIGFFRSLIEGPRRKYRSFQLAQAEKRGAPSVKSSYGLVFASNFPDLTFQFYIKATYGYFYWNRLKSIDHPFVFLDIGANQGLYAIGDLTGPPWLAHKASHEGVICVEAIAGKNDGHPFDASNVPGCTYAHPQVASVGLTEAKAKETGRKIKVGKFPFVGNGKAIALGAGDGLIKTIFDSETGELLGAHMIGAEVTELIQGYVIARQGELTEGELMETIFPHPTLSEMMHEAVLDAYGQVIHI